MEVSHFHFNFWLENYEEYNCSAFGDVDWSSRGTKRPHFGIFCVVFGLLTIPPYIMCAQIMLPMRNLSVIKIMLFLAVADIIALFHSAIQFGIMLIAGEVFCAHPRLQLLFSLSCELTFYGSILGCSILALNRFGEMLSIRCIMWLFQVREWYSYVYEAYIKFSSVGSRTWWVLGICTFAYVIVILFTPPLLFNSNTHMLQYDPMITKGILVYDNKLIFSIVTTIPIAAVVIYVAMLIGLLHKKRKNAKMKNSKSLSRATFQIVVQSGIIIVVHLTTEIAFEILPFFPPEAVDSMLYVAHVGWMLVHGSPPLVYLLVNQTIRRKLIDRFKPQNYTAVIAMSTTQNNQ